MIQGLQLRKEMNADELKKEVKLKNLAEKNKTKVT